MIIKHGRHTRCAKVCGLFFFRDCAFWLVIGWADELRSHTRLRHYVEEQDFFSISGDTPKGINSL